MKNMKVSLKLIVSFLIVVALAVIVSLVGIVGMYSINHADDQLYNENVVAVSAMGEMRETLQQQRVMTRNLVMYAGNAEKRQGTLNTLKELESKIGTLFVEYEKTITDPAEEDAYYDAKKVYQNDYADIKRKIIEGSAQSFEAGFAAQEEPNVVTTIAVMVDGFTTAMQNNDSWAADKSKDNTSLFHTMTVIEVIVLIVAVVIAMLLAFYISGLISKPLATLTSFMDKAGSTGDITLRPEDVENIKELAQVKDELGRCVGSAADFVKHVSDVSAELERVAGGDLTSEFAVLSDHDTMGLSLQKMVGGLNDMFGEIKQTAVQVSTASQQIADGAQALAEGSTDQASVVEQLSASVSEISDKTRQNADIAREAADLSFNIKNNAERGSRQMENMMQAVREINDASNQIEKVIRVIDDIAFQTNILALNAAVEAARAGEHGKGFAVVADEVRKLAAKSAEAAKDTGGLIENSMEKANLGLNIATETSGSLKDIVEGINRSVEIVTQIAESSDMQASAITQINTGIDQVAQVVQQNSATAQESAAASEEMSGQSQMMEQLVSQFKLKGATKG